MTDKPAPPRAKPELRDADPPVIHSTRPWVDTFSDISRITGGQPRPGRN